MLLRVVVVVYACVFGVASAAAEELGPEQAKAFVVGKLFAYTCFDGTAGVGRIFADGSVVGTIRPGGRGEVRFASLPPGTLRIEGTSMCAHLSGLPLQPCFRVERIDHRRFRGSIAGLGFAYCDFAQHNPRVQMVSRAAEPRTRFRIPAPAPVQTLPAAPAPPVVQTAPVVPVEATPITPAEATPIVPVEATSTATLRPATPTVPLEAAPTVPAEATPTATLRPAIND